MRTLVIGCGYLGTCVARRWRDAGEQVFVVTRSQEHAHEFQREGFTALVADVTQPSSLRNLPAAETILYAVGFDRSATASTGRPTIEEVYAGGLKNVLTAIEADDCQAARAPHSRQGERQQPKLATPRIIYVSTTGVYGPAAGAWVDESTPTDPRREGGLASLAAERILAAHPFGAHGIILRMAGLYGTRRVPFLEPLRGGEPIAVPESSLLNLIHVHDAAKVVVAAQQLPPFTDGPRVYCVSDGEPVERATFYREVARQLGAPAPTFVAPDLNSPRAVRAEANRRICNARMLVDLQVQLEYPNYRSGLAASLT